MIICLPICFIFFIYPEVLIKLFNITNPDYIQVISLAIRMTSFGLIGRCLTYLMANYTQAIGENRISFILTFLEEFGVAVASVLILTYFFGGVGIWFAILISESVPVLVYLFFVLRFRRNNKEEIDSLFMLQDSHLLVFTYDRDYEWNQADFHNIERIFA